MGLIQLIKNFFLKAYTKETYLIRKKAEYIFYIQIILALISIIALIFHKDLSDIKTYSVALLSFLTVLYFLKKGDLHKSIFIIICFMFLNVFNDIMDLHFSSYEKITETIMVAFLYYIIISFIAIHKRQIIIVICINSFLTLFHAVMIDWFTYSTKPLPPVALKYFIGGFVGVLLVGLLVLNISNIHTEAINILENDELLLKTHQSDLEQLVKLRTHELEQANLELQKLSYYDSLTDVFNRRKIFQIGEEQFQICMEHSQMFIGAILDIDNFKIINDTYGHAVGDTVIKEVVQTCSHCLRHCDAIGRIGGEEFVIILSNMGVPEALHLFENMCRKVDNKIIRIPDGDSIHVTISIGISYTTDYDTFKTLIHRADEALYKAKNNGKNQAYLITES